MRRILPWAQLPTVNLHQLLTSDLWGLFGLVIIVDVCAGIHAILALFVGLFCLANEVTESGWILALFCLDLRKQMGRYFMGDLLVVEIIHLGQVDL